MTELQYNNIKDRLNAIADELFALVKPTKEELDEAETVITMDEIPENYSDMTWHLGKINMLLTVIDNREMEEEELKLLRVQ